MMNGMPYSSAFCLLLAACLAPVQAGQASSPRLRGFATDATGSALPGVVVAVAAPGGPPSRAITDVAGWFTVTGLTPSRYHLTASLPGFRTVTRPDLLLNEGTDLTLELEMQVARLQEVEHVTLPPGTLTQPSGIRGTVSDTCGATIPGADITLTAESGRDVGRTTSDVDGTFRLKVAQPGSYQLSATLSGFRTFTQSDVAVEPGGQTPVDILLHIGWRVDMGPWVTPGDLRAAARSADAIVYLRIERVRGPREVCGVASQYQARPIDVIKRDSRGQPGDRFELLQQGSGTVSADGTAHPDERPYAEGDEFVALLTWNDRRQVFIRLAGPVYMIPIHDGRVAAGARVPGVTPDMTVNDLLATLRDRSDAGLPPIRR
jgi:hypothetical protein